MGFCMAEINIRFADKTASLPRRRMSVAYVTMVPVACRRKL